MSADELSISVEDDGSLNGSVKSADKRPLTRGRTDSFQARGRADSFQASFGTNDIFDQIHQSLLGTTVIEVPRVSREVPIAT